MRASEQTGQQSGKQAVRKVGRHADVQAGKQAGRQCTKYLIICLNKLSLCRFLDSVPLSAYFTFAAGPVSDPVSSVRDNSHPSASTQHHRHQHQHQHNYHHQHQHTPATSTTYNSKIFPTTEPLYFFTDLVAIFLSFPGEHWISSCARAL